LRRNNSSKSDRDWLKRVGANVLSIIKKQGYESAYDFWVHSAGDEISRATLNYVIAGTGDPKATTLRTIARMLNVKPAALFDVE